jgi:hypothetical protein
MGEGLKDAFNATGRRLAGSKMKIGSPALAGLIQELEDIDFSHNQLRPAWKV